MAVSEERIDELLEIMVNNVGEDGWCYMPEGLTDEENTSLSQRLTYIAMDDKIDAHIDNILNVIEQLDAIKNHTNNYDLMERLIIKKTLNTLKVDCQNVLIDLHSSDLIFDFFKMRMFGGEEPVSNIDDLVEFMEFLIDTEFKEPLKSVKTHYDTILILVDELNDILGDERVNT